MNVILKLPRLSSAMTEGLVAAWLKREGDSFRTGEPLYSVETEKVAVEVEAPCSGVLTQIIVGEGANIAVGAPVCRIERTGD